MSRHPEHQYLDLLKTLLDRPIRPDRTGTGTHSIFGHQMRFDLAGGKLPLLTTKFIPHRLVAIELLWFLSGDTNVRKLQEQGCHIWDEWANADGDLGPIYGQQWRSWTDYRETEDSYSRPIDQIKTMVEALKTNPYDRGHIVSAWNVAELKSMVLRPCHCLFQFYVADGRLSCQLYQRSADVFLGVPFNIASYAMLTMMMARVVGLDYGELVWTGGDVHLYTNHVEQARIQIEREPVAWPTLRIGHKPDMDSWSLVDLVVLDYNPAPHIPADVSI